jgi:Domain of unknown function (DUF6894)
MTRFFFDYTAKEQLLLDHQGHEFRSPNAAIDFARAIAHDLKHSLTENWGGWCVEVRNVYGTRLMSLPVDSAELEAA